MEKAGCFMEGITGYNEAMVGPDEQILEEKEKIMGDVPAAKLVVANMGPAEKRWFDKQQIGNLPGEKLEIEINVNEVEPKHGIKPEAEKSV